MSAALKDRIALVTGASRGIGAAAAIELARLGAQPVLIGRTVGGLEETDDAIRALGGKATLLPLDLREGRNVDLLGATLLQRFGRLDILVHAAGTLGRLTPVAHIQPDDWTDVVGVNLAAAWHLIRGCAPLLLAGEAGRAVFVTDRLVGGPVAYWGAYGATKAGMAHLVQSWAAETATSRLRVNLYDPGTVATKLRAAAFPGEDPVSLAKPSDVAPQLAALCLPTEARHGALVAWHPS